MKLASLLGLSQLVLAAAALPAYVEDRALCFDYKVIYTGKSTVDGHGSETVTISELGRLGLGRVYLPAQGGIVTAEEAGIACKAACSLGINGKNCLSTVVYHKCNNGDPFEPCFPTANTAGYWYCDFYTEKLTQTDFRTSGATQGGNIRSSTGYVQTC